MSLLYDELRDLGRQPRVHGNGFIQLDLNDTGTRRLHVWHEDIPRQTVATPIHDHVFALRSTVILGTLIHEELTPVESSGCICPGGDSCGGFVCDYGKLSGTHRVYRAEQEPGSQNTILVPDEGTVRLDTEQLLVLGAGSIYTFPAWKLHQTDHIGLTATFMDKINAPNKYGRPRVLVEIGTEPDNEFHRDGFDPGTLWPFIEEALSRAGRRRSCVKS